MAGLRSLPLLNVLDEKFGGTTCVNGKTGRSSL